MQPGKISQTQKPLKMIQNNISTVNRNLAYFQKVENLAANRKTVFELIKKHNPITAQELSSLLLWNINQISGRITELSEMFLIKPEGSKLNTYSNCENTLWTIVGNNQERVDLITAKFKELELERDALEEDLSSFELSDYLKKEAQKRLKKVNKTLKQLATF